MRQIRIKAYLIDFIVLFSVIAIINIIIPKTEYLNTLEMGQNLIMEEILMKAAELYAALSSPDEEINSIAGLVRKEVSRTFYGSP